MRRRLSTAVIDENSHASGVKACMKRASRTRRRVVNMTTRSRRRRRDTIGRQSISQVPRHHQHRQDAGGGMDERNSAAERQRCGWGTGGGSGVVVAVDNFIVGSRPATTSHVAALDQSEYRLLRLDGPQLAACTPRLAVPFVELPWQPYTHTHTHTHTRASVLLGQLFLAEELCSSNTNYRKQS